MKISIKSCLKGAQEARGLAVIIDVISASSTIVNLFEAGAKEIVPVNSMENAWKLKKKTPSYLVCGESRYTFSGLDLVNSPVISKPIRGKTVIIKTDGGTKGLLAATKVDKVIVGCFLNSRAIIDYIKKLKPTEVSLVPVGYKGREKAIEDELFAEYIKDILEGKKPDFKEIRKKILTRSWRNIFRYIFWPTKTKATLELNTSKIVPEMVNGRLVNVQKRFK